MKKIIIPILFLFASAYVSAQGPSYTVDGFNNSSTYKTAVGVKVYPGSITIKHFIKNNVAIEGLGYFWQYGFRLSGLYELHGNIAGAEGLKWYAGPGAHIGFYNNNWKVDYPDRTSGVAIGVDGVLGLDYKITGAPINISFDWQPSFNVIGYTYFEGGWGGLSVRYTF